MQILHYENGQKYEPHFDYFHDKANQQLGGHRIATVLMYLSDVVKGGETVFPNSEVRYLIISCYIIKVQKQTVRTLSCRRPLLYLFSALFSG